MRRIIGTKVRVEGKGDSKEKALNVALGNIQKKIMNEYDGNMIIRIEPLNIDIVEAIETSYIERFLFIFLPRERSKYVVKLDVEVNLSLLAVEEVHFDKIEQGDSVKRNIFG